VCVCVRVCVVPVCCVFVSVCVCVCLCVLVCFVYLREQLGVFLFVGIRRSLFPGPELGRRR
jgi:hypothetical protein